MQPQAGADGGTASIGEIITRLQHHRPIVVADRDSERVRQWRELGMEVHIMPQAASAGITRNPIAVLRSYARYARGLRRLIRQSGARVVHANDPNALQLALPAVKSTGTQVALNLRDTRDPERPRPTMRFRTLFAAADHVFYLSGDMADRWAEVAPNAKRACSVTYSIIDPVRFLDRPLTQPGKPPVVLLSGLIRRKKGQLDFLRNVTPRLAASGIQTWLAGDFHPETDSYMAACAEAAAPLGDAVRFLGYRADIPELMDRSSVVAVASRHEGLVRAMIEAMARARPVVSFDVCSAREVLVDKSGGAGVVVAGGDYASMADAILHYCQNPDAAVEAGNKGAETARRLFTAQSVVERYESVYARLATGSGAASA
jgi:glycosyltransferase involved in cell wall biosynthesis